MDNYAIADQLSLLAKLMEIHGANPFKAKSYATAAFTIEKFPQQVATLPAEKLFRVKGIGESVGRSILELVETGELEPVKELLSQTPEGVLEMMNIKGLGPKKIHTIWKGMQIDTIDALAKACEENRVAEQKGFGAKTQEKILASIAFIQQHAGKFLYAQVEDFAIAFEEKVKEAFPSEQTACTGEMRRHMDVIGLLEWVTTVQAETLKTFLLREGITLEKESDDTLLFGAENIVPLQFHLTSKEGFGTTLFRTTGSQAFLNGWEEASHRDPSENFALEEALFREAGIPYIPPYRRESAEIIQKVKRQPLSPVIQTSDIKGLIHAHSSWSDGAYTLEEMAEALIEEGFEYLVISDHSKAAYYANGLNEERIREQHRHIDALNGKLKPFKIFKSIECDILSDGTLDYDNNILALFDLVIVSVHSNLDMDEEKAMKRLLGAITNPYTTILGHMTGRLLLRRAGYPVDHKAIIDACADHGVTIEINASPSRLDIDWRWIDYALEKGLMLSIDPDAHTTEEFANLHYGVLVAQKGGLTKERNLSSFSLKEFEAFLEERRKRVRS